MSGTRVQAANEQALTFALRATPLELLAVRIAAAIEQQHGAAAVLRVAEEMNNRYTIAAKPLGAE